MTINNPTITTGILEPTSDEEDYYSDDSTLDDNEVLHFAVDGLEPIRRMILHLAQHYEEMFPQIQGKRRLNPFEFEQALGQLRAMFWNYRQVEGDDNLRYSFIREVLPIGSEFNLDGSYFTPLGVRISRSIRTSVRVLNQCY